MTNEKNQYVKLIGSIFLKYYSEGLTEVPFRREDIVEMASQLSIQLPKNLGDVVYSFRYRAKLPETIIEKAPEGYEWIIRPAGRSQFCVD